MCYQKDVYFCLLLRFEDAISLDFTCIRRVRTLDNVVGRGARRPGDVCSARTEAERRPNPRCLISVKEAVP